MVSLKKIFRSLVIASKGIDIKPAKSKIEPSPKPEEKHIEKSKLEKEVEEYIMLPLPETLTLEEMKRLNIKVAGKPKKEIKKEKKEKLTEKKPKIKKRKITKKKVKKKIKKKKTKLKVNKKELKKQLLKIEKRYEELKKRGYSDEELKVVRDKIDGIKKGLG